MGNAFSAACANRSGASGGGDGNTNLNAERYSVHYRIESAVDGLGKTVIRVSEWRFNHQSARPRTHSVTSRATRVTRKTWPSSASSAVRAWGSPTAGERSPKPRVVSVTEAEIDVLRLGVIARLREEGGVPQRVHREVQECEKQSEKHVGAKGSEHGLVVDLAVLEDAPDGHRQRGGDQQGDRQEVDEADDRVRRDEEDDRRERDAGTNGEPVAKLDAVAGLRIGDGDDQCGGGQQRAAERAPAAIRYQL
jgi:hypothetical protein